MKEVGIPWSDPMVLALLALNKWQTRRLIKPQPGEAEAAAWADVVERTRHPKPTIAAGAASLLGAVIRKGWKPRYRVGDRLWGREAWGVSSFDDYSRDGFILKYRADQSTVGMIPLVHSMADTIGKIKTLHEKWRPPMFFPRWAARLFHDVTAVRAERLLDISRDDAIAEGLERRGPHGNWFWPGGGEGFGDPRTCYLRGYDTIHGAGAAEKSPWVWVITFRPVDASHAAATLPTELRSADT